MRTSRSARFLFGKEAFFVLARKSRGCAEAYIGYAAQGTSKIDTARAEKDPFRAKTFYITSSKDSSGESLSLRSRSASSIFSSRRIPPLYPTVGK